MPMTTSEKAELGSIPLVGAIFWLATPALPQVVSVGALLLEMSVLLLFQGLVRDLWLLAKQRRDLQSDLRRMARCMCMESTVGVTGIVAGAVLLGSGIDRSVAMGQWLWGVLAMAVIATGFAIKDYVIESNPWRVHRDADHINIVFRWKQ